jgi:inner membrane organizing system protein 1
MRSDAEAAAVEQFFSVVREKFLRDVSRSHSGMLEVERATSPSAMATRPPELSMDAKWEAAIDLTLRRLVYGSLAGGAVGLMLFRAFPSRLHTERPGVGLHCQRTVITLD